MAHSGQDPDTGSRVTIDFQYGAGAGARAAQSVVSVVSVSGVGERSTLVLMVP